MSLLTSVSTEIALRILQNCDDFTDLCNLLLTCKHVHSIWDGRKGSIIWDVGRREIASFEECLIAVSIRPIFICPITHNMSLGTCHRKRSHSSLQRQTSTQNQYCQSLWSSQKAGPTRNQICSKSPSFRQISRVRIPAPSQDQIFMGP